MASFEGVHGQTRVDIISNPQLNHKACQTPQCCRLAGCCSKLQASASSCFGTNFRADAIRVPRACASLFSSKFTHTHTHTLEGLGLSRHASQPGGGWRLEAGGVGVVQLSRRACDKEPLQYEKMSPLLYFDKGGTANSCRTSNLDLKRNSRDIKDAFYHLTTSSLLWPRSGLSCCFTIRSSFASVNIQRCRTA
ncbi:hypothetical protein SRHO_G00166950 [Serrasalmus rhombeus]